MSFIGIALTGLVVLLACGWFLYVKAVNVFTADEPVQIATQAVTDAQYAAAEAKLNQLRTALHTDQATTVRFTSTDVNALIARDPSFSSHKGRMRIEIADSHATVELSVPLKDVRWPRLHDRWFNGRTHLQFSYDDSGFSFDPDFIEANGTKITGSVLGSFASSFSRSFTSSFERGVDNNGGGSFWKNVKSITLEGDSLVVVTRGTNGNTI